MFAVAVKGYGVVLWEDGRWRTFSASDSLAATLAARVEHALEPIAYGFEEDMRDALTSLSGATLLREDDGRGPGCCEGCDLRLR